MTYTSGWVWQEQSGGPGIQQWLEKWGAESMKRLSQSFYCLKENITQYTRALFKVKYAENMFVFPKFRGLWNPFCHFLITTLQVLHELLLLNIFLNYFLKGVSGFNSSNSWFIKNCKKLLFLLISSSLVRLVRFRPEKNYLVRIRL